MPLPVEVIPFGWASHLDFLRRLGGDPELRLREGKPFVTDEGNYTIDVSFRRTTDTPAAARTDPAHSAGRDPLADPGRLQERIRSRAGIVETGLFLGIASILVVGRAESAEILRKGGRS